MGSFGRASCPHPGVTLDGTVPHCLQHDDKILAGERLSDRLLELAESDKVGISSSGIIPRGESALGVSSVITVCFGHGHLPLSGILLELDLLFDKVDCEFWAFGKSRVLGVIQMIISGVHVLD